MKIASLTDGEYLKALLFIERLQGNPQLHTDKFLYRKYQLINYILHLHDLGKFPFQSRYNIEGIEIKMGFNLIKQLL